MLYNLVFVAAIAGSACATYMPKRSYGKYSGGYGSEVLSISPIMSHPGTASPAPSGSGISPIPYPTGGHPYPSPYPSGGSSYPPVALLILREVTLLSLHRKVLLAVAQAPRGQAPFHLPTQPNLIHIPLQRRQPPHTAPEQRLAR